MITVNPEEDILYILDIDKQQLSEDLLDILENRETFTDQVLTENIYSQNIIEELELLGIDISEIIMIELREIESLSIRYNCSYFRITNK